MATGRVKVRSRVTWASEDLSYAVVHLGDHNLSGGARPWDGLEAHAAMEEELSSAFGRADIAEVLRSLERRFPGATYSLRTLFRDEQKKILDDVLASTLAGVEQGYGTIYGQFAPLMRYLASLGQPVPKALHQAAEYTLTARLRAELERGRAVDLDSAHALVKEARDAGVVLGLDELGQAAQRTIESLLAELARDPDDRDRLHLAERIVAFASAAGLRVDLSVSQNLFYAMRESVWAGRRGAAAPDAREEAWREDFRKLGARLGVRVD
jgi:hypothetical protein